MIIFCDILIYGAMFDYIKIHNKWQCIPQWTFYILYVILKVRENHKIFYEAYSKWVDEKRTKNNRYFWRENISLWFNQDVVVMWPHVVFTLIFIYIFIHSRNVISSCNFDVWIGVVTMGGSPKSNASNSASGFGIQLLPV